MDLGVGSFVFSNGLVSPEARSIPCSLKKNIFSCVPLIVLGLFRLVSVSLIGYHENVAEYGVHWNFFFSLAAVRILSSLILHFVEVTKWSINDDNIRKMLLNMECIGISFSETFS